MSCYVIDGDRCWFWVDGGFHSHPKVLRLLSTTEGKRALALWALAGSWVAFHGKDGFVPNEVISFLGFADPLADLLVHSDLWVEEEGGYLFHDWADYNPEVRHD